MLGVQEVVHMQIGENVISVYGQQLPAHISITTRDTHSLRHMTQMNELKRMSRTPRCLNP